MINPTDVDYIRTQLKQMAASELSRGLLSEAGAQLIKQVADAPVTSAEDGLAVGRVIMPLHRGVGLIRLFVITGPNGEHILYVPTQPTPPGDRIFYEHHDMRRVGGQLVEFLGQPNGLEYMNDLLPEGQADEALAYFEELSRLPTNFAANSFAMAGVAGESYAHQIQVIVNR